MKRFLYNALAAGLLLVLLVSVISCTKTVYVSPTHTPNPAKESALDTDIKSVKSAVDAYMIASMKAPMEDGALPLSGEMSPIDFNASFIDNGQVKRLCPYFLLELPLHWDEGVWKLDNAARVVFDMERDKY